VAKLGVGDGDGGVVEAESNGTRPDGERRLAVTECDGAKDDRTVMSAGGYCNLSAHVPGGDVGPTVEETETKKKARKECDVSFRQPIRLWVIRAARNW